MEEPQPQEYISEPVRLTIEPGLNREEIGQIWRALEARSDTPFFLSWPWIGTWIEAFSLTPQLLVGRAAEKIVLLALLVPGIRRDIPLLRTDGLHLHETGESGKDIVTIEYNDFLVDRAWAGRIERAAVRFLLSGLTVNGRRRDELHMRSVSPLYEELQTHDSFFCTVTMRKESWRVDLAKIRDSGQSYLETLSANTRYQVRRSFRLYEQAGPLTISPAGSIAEALEYFAGLKALHVAQWSRKGHRGAFSWPLWEPYHHLLIARAFPGGGVELVRIASGEKTIGYLYNFRHRGTTYAYASGFLFEEDKRLKPGLVSHCLCIERHLNEGEAVYDFMAGTYRYKSDLGRPGPEMIYLIVQRRTPALRLEHALRALRRGLQSLMGQRVRPYARG